MILLLAAMMTKLEDLCGFDCITMTARFLGPAKQSLSHFSIGPTSNCLSLANRVELAVAHVTVGSADISLIFGYPLGLKVCHS